jgi:hypothetical protein
VPYILDEFAYFFETPYDVTDKNFGFCNLDRPSGASAEGRMYIVNHFLDFDIFGIKIPDQINAPKTNSRSSILAQANLCYQAWGRQPNFILVSNHAARDFVMDIATCAGSLKLSVCLLARLGEQRRRNRGPECAQLRLTRLS